MRFEHTTPEQVFQSLPFRIAKKDLMRTFPWIIDLQLDDPNEINKYSIIFLKVIIDPIKLYHQYGFKIPPYMKRMVKNMGEYMSPYLTTMYLDPSDRDTVKEMQDEISDTVVAISKSEAIPEELRLPKHRTFGISSYVIPGIFADNIPT